MAAPIYIERDMFIHWLNENPEQVQNIAEDVLGTEKHEHFVFLESLPSLINWLIETYCDREKS